MDVSGLGERGAELWKSLKSDDPVRNAVALEIARTSDRLDELDNIIQGKGVLNLMQFRVIDSYVNDDDVREMHIEVKFQNVLAEARQQQLALSNLISKIQPATKTAESVTPKSLPSNVSPIELARERAAKRM